MLPMGPSHQLGPCPAPKPTTLSPEAAVCLADLILSLENPWDSCFLSSHLLSAKFRDSGFLSGFSTFETCG